jgi:hypothetical protein
VKDGVKNGSEAIKDTATSSAAIFRDTMKAEKTASRSPLSVIVSLPPCHLTMRA